ncbi:unnamed protein product [Rhizoctonia solani]|uniref:Uncharacterized protein n=1 Tax=Rhizoctonia solani TaxID=456999 RepID=A0A8H3HG36_9AGAM|nr:unnamed protein product [Rhizoctonia solani]
MWILRYWVSLDGNFRLVRKAKKVDPNDISFTNGIMFYVEDEDYGVWVNLPDNNKRNTSGEKPQCDNHKAAADRFAKFGGLDVTGLIGVSCGRHTCYIPGGVADLKKGEKFAIGDYALAHVIELLLRHGAIPIGFTYDIWCHYIAKFKERAGRLPERLAIPADLDLVGAIPKFHIQGHTQECKVRWSLNNMPHVGRMEGEGVERGWAAFNQTSGSNSEKSPAFRHDSMNYLLNSWNLEKRDRMGPYLDEHFKSTKKMYIKQKVVFEELHAVIPVDIRTTWEGTSTEPTKVNGKWTSPFEFTEAQAQKIQQVLHEERQKESAAAPEPSCRTGATKWLLNAIEIENQLAALEQEEAKLDPVASYHRQNALNDKKKALTKRVNAHREERETFMPGMGEPDHPELPNVLANLEHVELALPSSYEACNLARASLDKLAAVEGKLRRAACGDALQGLKNLLGWKAQALRWKKANTAGEIMTTRAEGALKDHNEKVKQARQRYDRSWRALMRLNLQDSDSDTYRKLEDHDLKNLKDYLADDSIALGQGYASLPWIWRTGAAYNDKTWQIEGAGFITLWIIDLWLTARNVALRVEWFRARQRCKQWEEELVLLKRDMAMAARSLVTMQSIWQWKAAADDLSHGMREYANRTARFYEKQKGNLIQRCSKHITDPIVELKWATEHWPTSQALD